MMTRKPTIEIIPMRPAVRNDAATEMHVLIRVVPYVPEVNRKRPPLNIALVIDRSGSMAGPKLQAAKETALYAVRQLTVTDRVAIVIFDSRVETLVASTLATNKSALEKAINRIETGGSTAMHAAWVEGGIQVSEHLNRQHLNRVLLITDGLANIGETNDGRICSDVRGLSARGVSTSTLGIGVDFNEDLLASMSNSGDGNYYFVKDTHRLDEFFKNELQGLMATTGQMVSLGIEPQGGVEVTDVLNDLERNSYGRLQLPNLVAGSPTNIVAQLSIPSRSKEADVCFVRLAWTDPETDERHVIREAVSLLALGSREFDALRENPEVTEHVGLLEAARIRQRAIEEMQRGDIAGAGQVLQQGMDYLACMAPSPASAAEAQNFEELTQRLSENDVATATKSAKFQNYSRRRSR